MLGFGVEYAYEPVGQFVIAYAAVYDKFERRKVDKTVHKLVDVTDAKIEIARFERAGKTIFSPVLANGQPGYLGIDGAYQKPQKLIVRIVVVEIRAVCLGQLAYLEPTPFKIVQLKVDQPVEREPVLATHRPPQNLIFPVT